MNKKGFTMLDCLLVMVIISSLLVVSTINIKEIDLSDRYFIADYIYAQSDSLANYKESYVDSKYNIRFNAKSGVNKAQTINIAGKKFIIHLGTGYISEE